MESMGADGNAKPSGGTLTAFELPSGPGVRVDTFGYAGYTTNPNFDSLLAKLIAHSPSPDFADVVTKTYRALCEFKIEGVQANIAFLQSLLQHPEFIGNRVYTRFIEDNVAELVGADNGAEWPQAVIFRSAGRAAIRRLRVPAADSRESNSLRAIRLPCCIMENRKPARQSRKPVSQKSRWPSHRTSPDPKAPSRLPRRCRALSFRSMWLRAISVHAGQQLFVMEAMKMEHVIHAQVSGIVRQITVNKGDAVFEGHPLAFIEEADVGVAQAAESKEIDLDHIRNDLKEVQERHALGLDDARPEAVARRRKTHQRTARENVYDLCDPGTFVEYGPLVIAAQRRRRTIEDLVKNTPADGLVAGIGSVNRDLFGEENANCIVMSYDYTVLAGTQGQQNHRKKDRMFEIAEKQRLPVVFFTEGGGGRPGDTDGIGVGGPRLPRVQLLGRAFRAGAAGRHQFRALLRGQCGAARMLRRRHRDEKFQHRDGRSRDDRRRRARHLPSRGSRPHRRAGAQRRGRHRRRG